MLTLIPQNRIAIMSNIASASTTTTRAVNLESKQVATPANTHTASTAFGHNVRSRVHGEIPLEEDIPTSFIRTAFERTDKEVIDLTIDTPESSSVADGVEDDSQHLEQGPSAAETAEQVGNNDAVGVVDETEKQQIENDDEGQNNYAPIEPPRKYTFFPYTPLAFFDAQHDAHYIPDAPESVPLELFCSVTDYLRLVMMGWLKPAEFSWPDAKATLKKARKILREGDMPPTMLPTDPLPTAQQRRIGKLVHAEQIARVVVKHNVRLGAEREGIEPRELNEDEVQSEVKKVKSYSERETHRQFIADVLMMRERQEAEWRAKQAESMVVSAKGKEKAKGKGKGKEKENIGLKTQDGEQSEESDGGIKESQQSPPTPLTPKKQANTKRKRDAETISHTMETPPSPTQAGAESISNAPPTKRQRVVRTVVKHPGSEQPTATRKSGRAAGSLAAKRRKARK